MILDVKLDSGDPALGTGYLEVHFAVVVFVADDVGEKHKSARLFVGYKTNRDATDRVGNWHTGVHQTQSCSANGGHRAGTVRFQNVRNHADRVREIFLGRNDRGDGSLSQHSVTNFTTSWSTNRPCFAHCE